MFSHYQRVHARSTDKFSRRGHLDLTMEQGSEPGQDDSDLEPSDRITEASPPSEVPSPARDITSSSRKLRDELETMRQEFDTRMETTMREYKAKSETMKQAIDLLEKDE